MSPEQAAGRIAEVGYSSDIYSLGATFFHLLVGRPAFSGRNILQILNDVQSGTFQAPRIVSPEIPAPLNAICLKAMSLHPVDRYPSAREFASEIERWFADEPVLAHGEGFTERWYRRIRRHRAWVKGVATMVPLLLVVMTAAAYFVNAERLGALKQRDLAVDAGKREQDQRLLAEQSEQRAKEQESSAQSAALQAGKSLTRLLITNSERAQSEHDASAAVLWSSKALATIEQYEPEAKLTHRIRLARQLQSLPRPNRFQLVPESVRKQALTQAFSPNGKWLVLSGAMPGIAVLNVETGEVNLTGLNLKNMDLAPTLAFSKDGEHVLTASQDSKIRIRKVVTGEQIGNTITTQENFRWFPGSFDVVFNVDAGMQFVAVECTLPDNSHQIECFDLSKNPPTSVTLAVDGPVKNLQFQNGSDQLMVATKTSVHFYQQSTGQDDGEAITEPDMWNTKISPDGKVLITTFGSGYAQLRDASTRKPIFSKLDHRGPVTEAVFSPNSDKVLTLSSDLSTRLWNVATGEAIGPPMNHIDRPLFAYFRDDGKAVATVGLEHKVYVWEVGTSRLLGGPWFHSRAPAVKFDQDDLLIAVQGRCVRWDLTRSRQEGQVEIVLPNDNAPPLLFSKLIDNQDRVLIGNNRRLWTVDISQSPPMIESGSFETPMTHSAISENGRVLAALTESGKVEVWTIEGKPKRTQTIFTELKPKFIYLDDQGERLFVIDENGAGQLWSIETATQQGRPLSHAQGLRGADFSDDGSRLVTACADKTVRVWNSDTGGPLTEPLILGSRNNDSDVPTCVRFHPDNRTIAVGFESDEVLVHEPLDSSAPSRRFQLGGPVSEVHFSKDGSVLGASGYANFVSIWDWKSEIQLTNLFSLYLSTMTFVPNADIVATGSMLGSGFSLWDLRTGRILGPTNTVATNRLQVDRDRRWLLTGGRSIRLWDIQPTNLADGELESLLSLLSQRKIDEQGVLLDLSSDELVTKFNEVSRSLPIEIDPKSGLRILLTD